MQKIVFKISFHKLNTFIKNNWFFYLTGFLLLFGMKYFYSRASVNHLSWLLAPTAWWVQALSGIPFHFVPCEGYVNHTYQFVIALSCSGMQFMIITIATLLFPFIPQMDTNRKKIGWIISILPVSYALTILVNIIRILLSIYLPVIINQCMTDFASHPLIMQKSLTGSFLTPARLHTLIGTFVYFTSLFLIYQLTVLLTRRSLHSFLPPVFFYLALVLGIPFLNKAWQNGQKQFTEYALLVVLVCLAVLFIYQLWNLLLKVISRSLKQRI